MTEPDLTPSQHAMLKTLADHGQAEIIDRDLDVTLATMTDKPYIFASPTLAGAEGRAAVRDFYRHLMTQLPKDITFTLVTRTIGTDRIVSELILTFTHDVATDWLLPGIPSKAKQVELPVIVLYTFKGDKIDNERLYWDHASLLAQVGLLGAGGLPIATASVRRLRELSARS